MRVILWFVLTQFTGIICFAQQYAPTDQGSSVTFKIKNFGFNVDGSFTGLKGKIGFDPEHLGAASFDVTVDADKINTGNGSRDEHLRKESYFDVQNYPVIRFVSTGVTASGKKGSFIISGKLTIKGHTKDITFPFIATPMGNDYIFSGGFTIDRKDFGVGGSSTISNSLNLALTVLAKKQ
ncbi:MAG TPA: YceI family protein [Puia sp.]|nr:YceI family protein [Puia sp.]